MFKSESPSKLKVVNFEWSNIFFGLSVLKTPISANGTIQVSLSVVKVFAGREEVIVIVLFAVLMVFVVDIVLGT